MKYVLGLDVGIGSVGWAVIRNDDKKRIEDFGVRLFASGEDPKTRARDSQKRRAYRSSRRVIRRRSHRKWRVKAHFENIGMCKATDIDRYFETASPNIIALRTKALDEKVSPEELAACLINICNRRGYKAFYEDSTDGMTKEELAEFEENNEAIGTTLKIMNDGGYRTVAEMIQKDSCFEVENSEFRHYRNNGYTDKKILFTRDMLRDEVIRILNKQREFYTQLNQNNIDYILDVMFSQRDFEDGPGDPDDKYRKYTGFLDSLGNCTFYKDEKRGSRFTLLADIYSLTNVLSQFIYVDIETGEIGLTAELAEAMVDFALANGKISKTDINKIAKGFGLQIKSDSDTEISKCLKFINAVKNDFEECGYDWNKLTENYTDENSPINRIGIFLSENITPKRREEKIAKEFPELNEYLISKLVSKKASGTSNACYRFMRESIEAFLRGESYGSFQAKFNNENSDEESNRKRYKTLPPLTEDYEFYDNPVVFRAINETRKIINAVVRKYGSPYAVNIEVGTELNKSLEKRKKEESDQRKNEKAKQTVKKTIADLLGISEAEVTPSQIERYMLGEEQGWKCLYSGKPIDSKAAILNTNHSFEVDHIIPFSLILDNTLSNKALVYYAENQKKGKRTPLMYLDNESAKGYIGRVNSTYGKKKEYRRKYQYLMLRSFETELLREWKSRNLNDTRYISKFLVNYIKNNLELSEPDNGEKYRRQSVYAVKSAITSRLRRQWLNSATWGNHDKADLKKITCLDHAVDAIVIANCIPAYVEIAALNQRLRDIFYSSGKKETQEYIDVLNTSTENLMKYYGVPKRVSENLLRYKKITPSLVPNLREEVDIRVCDCFTDNYFAKKEAMQKNKSYEELSDEEIAENFRKKVNQYYSDDPNFAASVHMPLFSLKQDKKANKGMFADNPLSIKTIDGVDYRLTSKPILSLKKKDIPHIYTSDVKLISSLTKLMDNYKDDSTVEEALKNSGESKFIYNGRQINKVRLKSDAPKRYFVKSISENNSTVLDNTNYYCIEIYKDEKGKTGVCAIAYSDLVKVSGKLHLNSDYTRPSDYAGHIMYLFPGDYVRIDKGGKVVEGYYRSVKSINRNDFYFTIGNQTESTIVGISQKAEITKIDVDILGNKGGEIVCGEPLSLIKAKS